MDRGDLFLVLTLLAWLFSPAAAYWENETHFTIDTQIESIGIISDKTDHRIRYGDPDDDYSNYSAVTRYTDSTSTTGGRISEIKNVDPDLIQKSLTFESSDFSHMISEGGVSDSESDDYRDRSISAHAKTIFPKMGTLESKASFPYGDDFFTYSVKPTAGNEHAYALTETQLRAHSYDPSFTPLWDFGFFTIGLMYDPGNFTQTYETSDRTSIAGNISNFRKAYSAGEFFQWNNTTWNERFEDSGMCVFYRRR